jgi:glycerol-3-phosphate acyltransferase PlsX
VTKRTSNLIFTNTAFNDQLLHEQASEQIEMCDEPATAVRNKPDSSIVVGARLVKDGKADALVGAGNTGAMMAAALLTLGRIPGVARPGIAVELPALGTESGTESRQVLIDAGATIDSEPEWLVQHALMAQAYVEHRLGIENPTIGLLSNGEESSKGDELRKKTHELLKDVKGFIGNCEGRDLTTGHPTVVVTDGFTGNVALKTIEGVYRSISALVISVLSRDELRDAGAQVIPPLMDAAMEVHPDSYGGAVLLGVTSPVVISHGSANSDAIFNAIRVAVECVETGVVPAVHDAIEQTK